MKKENILITGYVIIVAIILILTFMRILSLLWSTGLIVVSIFTFSILGLEIDKIRKRDNNTTTNTIRNNRELTKKK